MKEKNRGVLLKTFSILFILFVMVSVFVSCKLSNDAVEEDSAKLTTAFSMTQSPTPMATPTKYITSEPTENITPPRVTQYVPGVYIDPYTPVPSANPEQSNLYEIIPEECTIDEYSIGLDGDYLDIAMDIPCSFVRVYSNYREIPICCNYSDDEGIMFVMEYEKFPCNTLVNLRVDFYDENCYLTESKLIKNFFFATDAYSNSAYDATNLSEIGKYTEIEELVLTYGIEGDISSLSGLKNLKRLHICHCEAITGDIKVVRNFKNLKYFNIFHTYCPSFLTGDVTVFNYCEDIEFIRIYGCEGIYGDTSSLIEKGITVVTATLEELVF